MAQTEPENLKHWSQINEVGAALGLSFLFWVHRLLGRWPFRLICLPVIAWFIWRHPRIRKASTQFLTRANTVRQAQGLTPVAVSTWKHVLSFSEVVLDQLIGWKGGITLSDVDFQPRPELDKLLAQKKGFLLLGCHLGNLELCRVLSHLQPELRVHVLTHTRHAEKFNRLRKRLNPNSQVNLTQVTGIDPAFAAKLLHFLNRGDIIAITGDRTSATADSRNSLVDFLGQPALFPQGPYLLAKLLHCPIFTAYCLKRGNRYEISMPKLTDEVILPRQNRKKTLDQYAQRYARQLESYAIQEPYQWFNFYPFWSPESMRNTPDSNTV